MALNATVLRVLLAGWVLSAAAPMAAHEADRQRVIRNQSLTVAVDGSKGVFTIQHRRSGKTFVTEGRLGTAGDKADAVAVADKVFGVGQAIEVAYPDGRRDRILLLPRLPFVLFRSSLSNVKAEASSAALPAERLDLLERTMPSHGLLPLPVDLFENDPPRLWLLTDTRRSLRRDVIALDNWDAAKPAEFDCPPDRLGLVGYPAYAAFDYWGGTLLPPLQGRLRLSVSPQSCRILAVRPVLDRPQLISTSRHVTQGMVDLVEEKWEDAARTLRGKSRVVGGDPYEMRMVVGSAEDGWTVKAANISALDQGAGVRLAVKQAGGLVRATIESPADREVAWYLASQRRIRN